MTAVEIYVYPETGAGERGVHVLGHSVYREMGSLGLTTTTTTTTTTTERPDVSTIDLNRFQFLAEFVADVNLWGEKRAEKGVSHAFVCA